MGPRSNLGQAPDGSFRPERFGDRELLLDRDGDDLVTCPADFDAATHAALVARYRLGPVVAPARTRGACSGRLTRIRRAFRRRA